MMLSKLNFRVKRKRRIIKKESLATSRPLNSEERLRIKLSKTKE